MFTTRRDCLRFLTFQDHMVTPHCATHMGILLLLAAAAAVGVEVWYIALDVFTSVVLVFEITLRIVATHEVSHVWYCMRVYLV